MSLHIGTSGWAYKEWKPAFYPADVPQDRFLAYYGSVLTACEINATHYRVQPESVVVNWAAAVPESFPFSVKIHKRLTDVGAMAWDATARAFLDRFVESVRPLGPRLGCMLLQYEADRERDDAALDAVLAALPGDVPVAFEFKHVSWFDAAILDRVAEHGATVCASETAGDVLERLPPGPFAYVRLRGEHYSAQARGAWLDLLRREAADRPVMAFTRHEGIPAGDPFAGVGLAEWMVEQP